MTSWLPRQWGFLAQSNVIGWAWKRALKWVKAVKCLCGECVCLCVCDCASRKRENKFHLPIVHTVPIRNACVIIKPSSLLQQPTLSLCFSSFWWALSFILHPPGCFINFLVFLHFLSLPLPPDVWMYPICLCLDRGGQHWPHMAVLWNALPSFEIEKTHQRDDATCFLLWWVWNNRPGWLMLFNYDTMRPHPQLTNMFWLCLFRMIEWNLSWEIKQVS